MCGEKLHIQQTSELLLGSPPRVRGKAAKMLGVSTSTGITPACAGKSLSPGSHRDTHRDHPRVCGEKGYYEVDQFGRVGSPPRVRGKDQLMAETYKRRGITPACAGKSLQIAPVQIRSKDHPRVCGEKSTPIFTKSSNRGSPPRVRGKGEFRTYYKT